MADTRNWSDKLGDFGMALGGDFGALQGVRDRRALDEDRKRQEAGSRQQRSLELSEDRKKIAAQDFRNIGIAVDSGQIDEAKTRINERLRIGAMLPDFDAVSSQRIKDLLDSGDIQGASKLLSFADELAVSGGFLEATQRPESFVLGAEDIRFENGVEVARGMGKRAPSVKPVAPVPQSIIESLPVEIRAQAVEAYNTAGGDNAGLNAINSLASNRAATQAEEVESAAVTETANKARGIQLNAIGLASSILSNPETTDVVGSFQGRGVNNMFDPENTQAVADIEELANILTGENLDIMSGVLSETDIKIIRSIAGGGLDRRRSDTQFMKRVEDILFSLATAQEFTPEELQTLDTDQLLKYREVLQKRQ